MRDLQVDEVTGRVYQADSGGVVAIDGNTGSYSQRFTKSYVTRLAVDMRAGKLFISSTSSGTAPPTIDVINSRTMAVIGTISSESSDQKLLDAFADDLTHTLHVLISSSAGTPPRLALFNEETLTQTDSIPLNSDAANLAFDPARRVDLIGDESTGAIEVLPNATPAQPPRVANLSTRGYVSGGGASLIAGLIINGNSSKQILLRAIGPSLNRAGVSNALADPTVELHDANGSVWHNDDWQTTDRNDFAADQAGAIAATQIAPSDPKESALLLSLAPGVYTAIMSGNDGASGIGVVEVYDLDAGSTSVLANLSTRGIAGSGDNVLIGGLITTGSTSSRVVFRAIGPSLAKFGVASPLLDPVLEIRDVNGGLVNVDDDWQSVADEVNATGLVPDDPRESALVSFLYPSNYTIIVRGKDGASGIALVEAYRLDN